MGILLVVIFIPVILIVLYLGGEKNTLPYKTDMVGKQTIHIGNVPIKVTVADTEAERTQGLSGKKSLQVNEGLLFIFSKSGAYGIWMKDMQFPIDIIWISKNGYVVDIKKGVTPQTFPTIFYPRELASYILEVNALFTEVRGIRVGDKVSFPKNLF